MSDLTQISDLEGTPFVKVSRSGLAIGILCLVLLTILAIGFFNRLDPEIFFGGEHLAMKVGGNVITIQQLRILKALAGPKGERMTEKAFAQELLEKLLLAEAGRKLKLDEIPAYREKVAIFDKSLPPASDPQDLSRALFLIEELSNLTKEYVYKQASKTCESPPTSLASTTKYLRKLHLKTILAKNEIDARKVLENAAAGISFSELNASWSMFPFQGVGSDLGWVNPIDLPEGIFQKMELVPVGSTAFGFSDELGVHLFYVVAKPESKLDYSERVSATLSNWEIQTRELGKFVKSQQEEITTWVNSSLK